MTEIFYDESNSVLQDMHRSMVRRKNLTAYNQEIVQEIFRGVHTLKADSAMMLYENMAELSKTLEELLYCFRGEEKKVEDTQRFEGIVEGYVTFFEEETHKLVMGKNPDGSASGLVEEIREYTSEMKGKMEESEIAAYQSELSKPKRQIFYIASATEEETTEQEEETEKEDFGTPVKTEKELQSGQTDDSIKKLPKVTGANAKKQYTISEEEREALFRGTRNLQRLVNHLEYKVDSTGQTEEEMKLLAELKEIEQDFQVVKSSLTKADFVSVARKMEIVVEEMSQNLGKMVRLIVKGEQTPVDFEKREKISSALIHLIRNAVDHGIEDMDERERLGKPPVGLIHLKFITEDGHLKISVKDDGAGIQMQKVLKKAKEMGKLHKPEEEYSREEVFALLQHSGMTTTEEPNEYSGRGVGMDVITHNVQELGGKLKIKSQEGIGTTVTMRF